MFRILKLSGYSQALDIVHVAKNAVKQKFYFSLSCVMEVTQRQVFGRGCEIRPVRVADERALATQRLRTDYGVILA